MDPEKKLSRQAVQKHVVSVDFHQMLAVFDYSGLEKNLTVYVVYGPRLTPSKRARGNFKVYSSPRITKFVLTVLTRLLTDTCTL